MLSITCRRISFLVLIVYILSLAPAQALWFKKNAKPAADESQTDAEVAENNALEAGNEQLKNKEFADAKKTFRQLSWQRPMDPVPMLKMAEADNGLGDLDDALQCATKAVQFAPNYIDGHVQLAHLLEQNRNWKEAALQFERAVDLEADKEKQIILQAPALQDLMKAEEEKEAEGLSKKWLQQNKKSADCYYNRAWILAQSPDAKKIPAAISLYMKLLHLDQNRYAARYNLALLLIKNKRQKEAVPQLEAFIKQAPADDSDVKNAQTLLSQLKSTEKTE